MALREAKLIIPRLNNEGHAIPNVLQIAVDMLVNAFGGATVNASATGYWKDDKGRLIVDRVNEVTVAVGPDHWHSASLRDVAKYVAVAANQHSVYLRFPDGTVEFITQEG